MSSPKVNFSKSKPGTLPNMGLLLLMAIPILVITLFQAYWLRENYQKEEKNLELRANVAFKETIRKLQGKNLKLGSYFRDSSKNLSVSISNTGALPDPHMMMEESLAGYINNISIKVSDSLKRKGEWVEDVKKGGLRIVTDSTKNGNKPRMIFSMNKSNSRVRLDSLKEFNISTNGPQEEIVRFLYSVDSLQDSLRIPEIDSAVRLALKKEGINIPFSVSRNEKVQLQKLPTKENVELHRVTIGFARPVTYQLNLGNSSLYLLNKLLSPILFSLFLVGVTILSFAFLYRNLLKQRRLSEIKNEFISNITHELKTPIATVGVAIEALRNFNAINDPLRTKEYLDISQNELQRLSLLVDKVLKLSMFEKKEIDLKFETVDLKEVIEEVLSSMKLQIEKHHATVSLNTTGDPHLSGDRLHLLSVVFNLLDNSLKYGNGNTAIKIELKEKENSIELVFADNGIGIPAEYKDKVFEKFFRVPAGDKHNSKGYGLGLSYVAHVVQQHKGKISVESQPGLGTKFSIVLPKQSA